MSMENDVILLDTIQSPQVNLNNLLTAWDQLVQKSAESISAGFPNVFDFAANNCLYFFIIQHIVDPDAEDGERKSVCSEDPIKDAYDRQLETIGIIYLSAAHLPSSVNVGMALLPQARELGFGGQAMRLLVNWVFAELQCHRVQAQIVDGDPKLRDISLGLFTGLGFSHEGTLRRALFYPIESIERFPREAFGEWRDIVNLAILDTDWAVWAGKPGMPRQLMKSRWEELFARHEREQRAMLLLEEWEEQRGRGTRSTENISASVVSESKSGASKLAELEADWEYSSQASVSTQSSVDNHSQNGKRASTGNRTPTDSMTKSTSVFETWESTRLLSSSTTNLLSNTPPPNRRGSRKYDAMLSRFDFAGQVEAIRNNKSPTASKDETPQDAGMAPNSRSRVRRGTVVHPNDKDAHAGADGLRRRTPFPTGQIRDNARTSSPTPPLPPSEEASDSEVDLFSDMESVPRSPSVMSIGSLSSTSTLESWDVVE